MPVARISQQRGSTEACTWSFIQSHTFCYRQQEIENRTERKGEAIAVYTVSPLQNKTRNWLIYFFLQKIVVAVVFIAPSTVSKIIRETASTVNGKRAAFAGICGDRNGRGIFQGRRRSATEIDLQTFRTCVLHFLGFCRSRHSGGRLGDFLCRLYSFLWSTGSRRSRRHKIGRVVLVQGNAPGRSIGTR